MKELQKRLNHLLENSSDTLTIQKIMQKESIAPFSTANRLMAYLLAMGEITYDDYIKMSDDFCERNQQYNQYLYLFDMAPRTFGQTWGEQHIRDLFPQFQKATRENLADVYPSFDGEFDLWINGIRIEVKACRANSTNTKGSLSSRAYSHEDAKKQISNIIISS